MHPADSAAAEGLKSRILAYLSSTTPPPTLPPTTTTLPAPPAQPPQAINNTHDMSKPVNTSPKAKGPVVLDDSAKAQDSTTVYESASTASSNILEPRTYIDPTADVVLRSTDGREFRVWSYFLKANS